MTQREPKHVEHLGDLTPSRGAAPYRTPDARNANVGCYRKELVLSE